MSDALLLNTINIFPHFSISETMMKTDEIKENIRKEKEATEKSAAKLFAVYDQFMKVLNEDYEKLREASEEMKNVKPKYK